jgi:hypothetical protein
MEVWDGRLWVGTMDWSHPAAEGADAIFKTLRQPAPIELAAFFAVQSFGGDLLFFQSSRTPAVAESMSGIGNPTNYGIRNMVRTEESMFVGMANPSNLLTHPSFPQGGWELIELTATNTTNTTPLNLLTHFSCHQERREGPERMTCNVVTEHPAPAGGLTLGVIGHAPDAEVDAPLLVHLESGEKSVTFAVEVGAVAKDTTAILVAGLNGGTRVASVQLTRTSEGASIKRAATMGR